MTRQIPATGSADGVARRRALIAYAFLLVAAAVPCWLLGGAVVWDYASVTDADTRAFRWVGIIVIAIPSLVAASLATGSLIWSAATRRVPAAAAIGWGLAGLVAGTALLVIHHELDLLAVLAVVWVIAGCLVLVSGSHLGSAGDSS
jgi:hypothetical protein